MTREMFAAIVPPAAAAKSSNVGPRKPTEVGRSEKFGREQRGVRRNGLVALAAAGTSSGGGGDASKHSHNWASIAASPSQTKASV